MVTLLDQEFTNGIWLFFTWRPAREFLSFQYLLIVIFVIILQSMAIVVDFILIIDGTKSRSMFILFSTHVQ